MNDRGQLGIGQGIGIDMIESESNPKELDFTQSWPGHEDHLDPVFIKDVYCGQNTMMMTDFDGNVFKTGNRLDYIPKKVDWDAELLKGENVDKIACGKKHYMVIDKNNNAHCFGNVFKASDIGKHAGFKVYDCEQIFEGGKVDQLAMQYEIFGALVRDD